MKNLIDKLDELYAKASAEDWNGYRMTVDGELPTDEQLEKADGPADVCHTGNGPTSRANADAVTDLAVRIEKEHDFVADKFGSATCATCGAATISKKGLGPCEGRR